MYGLKIENSIINEQRTIQTQSDVFWVIQLIRNISKDNEQYILRIITWRNTSKLYRWLCNTCQNKEGIGRKNNTLSKSGRKHNLCFK